MQVNLNDTIAARLPLAPKGKRYEVNDKRLPGFILRVGARSKVFYWRTKVDNRRVTIQLGRFGHTSTVQARVEALRLALETRHHYVPASERKPLPAHPVPTFMQAFEAYVKLRKLKPASIATYQKNIRLYLSDWTEKPVTAITPQDALHRYQKLRDGVSPAKANGAFSILKSVLRFAAATYELNLPDIGEKLKAAGIKAKTPARHDVISTQQAKAWFEGLQTVPEHYRNMLLLTQLTGLRLKEVQELRWRSVDFEQGTLLVEETKNGQPHCLPLGTRLLSWLHTWKPANALADEAIFKGRANNWADTASKRMGIKFSMHTLRRTFATMAAKLAPNAYLVKALMNHMANGDVTQAHYIRYTVDDLRPTMQQIEDAFMTRWHQAE